MFFGGGVLAYILAYMTVGLLRLISPSCHPLLYLYKTYFPTNDFIPVLIPFLLASDSKTYTKNGTDVSLDKLHVT